MNRTKDAQVIDLNQSDEVLAEWTHWICQSTYYKKNESVVKLHDSG